jgi:DNA-binding PadR family transcriptional regulator
MWRTGQVKSNQWLPAITGPPAGQGPPDRGLLIDSPAVYKVNMTQRAMQEATFLILTALAAGSQHGYGIITDVQEISGGRVRLRAGTLYTALERLRTDELIAVDREEIVENRLRRYYRLTPKGSGLLAAEAARLQANAAAALSRLDLAGGMA